MDSSHIEADHVIVGAGAAGLAFADTLLASTDRTVILVDRRARPGGHWNDAYPYVRLHAPSALYGVESRALGSGRIERGGYNDGLLELATGAEVLAYHGRVLHETLLPSGRLTYLPLHDHDAASGEATSLTDGTRRRLHARRSVVDATLTDTRVPSTHPPAFAVARGAVCVTPDELSRMPLGDRPIVLIGAGKTAMDTAVWLLERGVAPERITWVRPRDAWLLDRAHVQTDVESFMRTMGGYVGELDAVLHSPSVAELFSELESRGLLQRIDPTVEPTMYRCAIVSAAELAQLRRIERVVRLGHVRALHADRVVLDRGTLAVTPAHVHVHCTADGIPRRPPEPIFQPRRIALQYVRRCSPCFSAALVAWVEATFDDDAQKNALCGVVPLPDEPIDWLRMLAVDASNTLAWSRSPPMRHWLKRSRLNAVARMIDAAMVSPNPAQLALLARYADAIGPASARLAQWLEAPSAPAVAAPHRPECARAAQG